MLIYHNPRCSKSRQTLALLTERGIDPTVIRYLDAPPSAARVLELARMCERPVHDLLRPKEAPYRELGLSDTTPDEELAAAVAAHPRLLERPIVVADARARIGRPPEAVLELL